MFWKWYDISRGVNQRLVMTQDRDEQPRAEGVPMASQHKRLLSDQMESGVCIQGKLRKIVVCLLLVVRRGRGGRARCEITFSFFIYFSQ